jgi:hypothetical protein|tara:strand:- start:12 stop:230 length:219 start_codon:yes stop_codon:yes gene_type:complete
MSREPMDIAKELRDASPQEAADLWTIVSEDKYLAIRVHDILGKAGAVSLAHKLGKVADNGEKPLFENPNDYP